MATDVDPVLLDRAARAHYRASSVRHLPSAWLDAAFDRQDELDLL